MILEQNHTQTAKLAVSHFSRTILFLKKIQIQIRLISEPVHWDFFNSLKRHNLSSSAASVSNALTTKQLDILKRKLTKDQVGCAGMMRGGIMISTIATLSIASVIS